MDDWAVNLISSVISGLVILAGGWFVFHRRGQEIETEKVHTGVAMQAEQRQEFGDLLNHYKGLLEPLKAHADAVDAELAGLREAQAVAATARAALAHEHADCLGQLAHLAERVTMLEAYRGEAR